MMSERLTGRELDAAVAEQCLGWEWISYPSPNASDGRMLTLLAPPEPAVLPNYIRDMSVPSDANAPRFHGWDELTYWENPEAMNDLYSPRPRGFGKYSSNMGDAWILVEWARQQGADDINVKFEDEHWSCRFISDGFWMSAYADTPTEAICYAALELARHLKGAGNE